MEPRSGGLILEEVFAYVGLSQLLVATSGLAMGLGFAALGGLTIYKDSSRDDDNGDGHESSEPYPSDCVS
jgi:hypothetical protein